MRPAAVLRILARDFQSDAFNRYSHDYMAPLRLRFSDFFVESIAQGNIRSFEYARKYFDKAMYGDCLIEREYQNIPPMAKAYSGIGAIETAPEELLLLFRLFRPGDLVFVAVAVEKVTANGEIRQLTLHPYRVISGIGGDSTRQFVIRKAEVATWEDFATSLRASLSWTSDWFKVARHFFLFGSSDEFNPNFSTEVDRVANYVMALEAAVVPEKDFVARRLRERAVKLLELEDDAARKTKKLLNEFYEVRSTLVHGGLPTGDLLSLLQDRECWLNFETLVRELLVAALKKIPSQEAMRRKFLASLYDVDDRVRAARISDEFKGIKNRDVKRSLLKDLQNNSE